MGLAQRKDKQRIGWDPRNLTWSNDTNRFSFKHMTAMGWDESRGLGKNHTGDPNHIAVARKLDNTGIGMGRLQKEGQDLSAGAGQAGAGLEDVLRRLASRSASAAASPSPSVEASPAPSPAPASPRPTAMRNKIASRQRHLNAKRMASQSPAALAEILGVPVSSLPATPSASAPTSGTSTPAARESSAEPETAQAGSSVPDDSQRNSLDTITTSSLSVGDYFRQKMREKMLARQAASGSSTPVPTMSEGSLSVMREDVKVAIGGVQWEGHKMKFEAQETTIADLGGDSAPSVVRFQEVDIVEVEQVSSRSVEPVEEKKEKRDKKEKKDKSKKKDKRSSSDSTPEAGPSTPASSDDKAAKKARKEAKKAEKAAKAAAAVTTSAEATPETGVTTPALSEDEEKRRRKEAKRAKKAEESRKDKDEGKKEKKEKKRKRDEDREDEGKRRKSSK